MAHCPSEEWDRYEAMEESRAIGEFVAELHAVAYRLLPSIIARNSTELSIEQLVALSYHAAATVFSAREGIDMALGNLTATGASQEIETWQADFWRQWEDLLP